MSATAAFSRSFAARPALATVVTIVSAVALGLATVQAPTLVLLATALALAVAAGIELCVVVAALAASGLLPFVDSALMVGTLPLWLLGWGIALVLMLVSVGARALAGRPRHTVPSSALFAAVVALLAYTVLRLAAASPFAVPSISAPYVVAPAVALVTAVWLSYPETLVGLRRALPVVVGLVGLWGIVYVLSATGGCAVCLNYVVSDSQRPGLLGPMSRVYASGGGAFVVVSFVCVARLFQRASWRWGLATLLALAVIALEAFRAQYAGVLAGLALLLAWRARWSSPAARVAILLLGALAFIVLLSSPIGARGLSAGTELRQHSGNPGYRLNLLAEQRQHWSLFGMGVTPLTRFVGINYDLGISNTLVVLGWLGSILQSAVLVFALVRGWRNHSGVGLALAGTWLAVLASRVSLPFLEAGGTAGLYGLVIGFAIALPGRPLGTG